MTTVTENTRKGNSKTAKQKTPTPAETPPDASQGLIPAATFKGRKLAFQNINGDLTTLDQLGDVVRALCNKMGGLAFLLNQTHKEGLFKLPLALQAAIQFAADSLKEGEERLYSILPDDPSLDSGWLYTVPAPGEEPEVPQ